MPDSSAPAVTVNVVYLARLRAAFGRAGEALALDGGATVADLMAALRARGDPFAAELAKGARAARGGEPRDLARVRRQQARRRRGRAPAPVTGGDRVRVRVDLMASPNHRRPDIAPRASR